MKHQRTLKGVFAKNEKPKNFKVLHYNSGTFQASDKLLDRK